MKNKYFLSIILFILIVLLTTLYFVEIPVPSLIVTENYEMDLK